MLTFDRQTFLALAFGLHAGACGSTTPAPTPIGNQTVETAPAQETSMAPAQECIGWTPAGECNEWMPAGEAAYAPATECMGYSPAGECNQWEPVQECVGWTPTGECNAWQPANEQ